MKYIKSFEQFVNEAEITNPHELVTKEITVTFDIDWNKAIGKVSDKITLGMSPDSTGLYKIGKDVEKFTGIPEADVIGDVKAGKETPDDAIIYGMQNIMNGGKDIYLWINGTRLAGSASKEGIWPALFEILSHECVHATRKILTRAIAKNKGIDITNEEWVNANYGGTDAWPAIGDNEDKKNPIVLIDEEAFATACGYVVQQLTPHFLEMASTYIPQLTTGSKL